MAAEARQLGLRYREAPVMGGAAALAKGLGEPDQTATIQILEEIAGTKVRKR